MVEIICDVLIIGVGVVGFMVVNDLWKVGLLVVVLEVCDCVGGCLWIDVIDGVMFEIGGQWVLFDQDVFKDVIEEFGFEMYSWYWEGDSVYVGFDGQVYCFMGEMFFVVLEIEVEIVWIIEIFDVLVVEIDFDKLWEYLNVVEWDLIFWDVWLCQQIDDDEVVWNLVFVIGFVMFIKLMYVFFLLQFLFMVVFVGLYLNFVDVDFIFDKCVVGGLQQVLLCFVECLGDDVLLNQFVCSLEWFDDGVVVMMDEFMVWVWYVIFVYVFVFYSCILFVLLLLCCQYQLYQYLLMGFVIKVYVVYDCLFWCEQGFSGMVFSLYELLYEVYDNINYGDECGILVGFVFDVNVDGVFELLVEECKECIFELFLYYYGFEVKNFVVYYESDWGSEEWMCGVYVVSFDFGGFYCYGVDLCIVVGFIYFVCSDMVGVGYQYVDGVIWMGYFVVVNIVDVSCDVGVVESIG